MKRPIGLLLLTLCAAASVSRGEERIVPKGWDPALAGDLVMDRLVTVTGPRVKGAHDAEFALVDRHAYIVAEVNEKSAGESAKYPHIFSTLSIVSLDSLKVEDIYEIARGGQEFANTTLPAGAVFVPRIHPIDDNTLRCYFASEQPGERQSQIWYRDFDIETRSFSPEIHKAKLKTAAGVFDMQPRYFHADAVANGFKKPATDYALYLFDSFKSFDGKTFVTLNNYKGKQNALALVHPDFATFEVLGHYNEPQTEMLSESSVNRLPDGVWMAICRNDGGNYHFTTSPDGIRWSEGREMPFVPNGAGSKPTFNRFGNLYYLGWQENTRIYAVGRSVFNLDVSRDGVNWERKYRFETTKSFQYPTFRRHDGEIWLTVTQGDRSSSRKERIMFGKLEDRGAFDSQEGRSRKPIPVPPMPPAIMKPGVQLFLDRTYTLRETPESLKERPFLRTTIDDFHVQVSKGGILYALTPPETISGAASQEKRLRELGFTRTEEPVFELFRGRINQVCVYRKLVKPGDRFHFNKVVLLVEGEGTKVESKPTAAGGDH